MYVPARLRANEVKGSVHVGCHVSVALYSLEHILPKFLRQHPQLEIKLHHQLSRRVTDSVITGDLDVVLSESSASS